MAKEGRVKKSFRPTVRVGLRLGVELDRRVEDIVSRMNPPPSKQRYLEEAVIQRVGRDWKTI